MAKSLFTQPGWLPGLVVGAVLGSILTAAIYLWSGAGQHQLSFQDPAAAVLAKSTKIKKLKAQFYQMDEICRGTDPDSLGVDACDAREKVTGQLKQMDYCYGTSDPADWSEAQKTYDFYSCKELKKRGLLH